MMLAYFGSRISQHMTRTPEGFLVCRDVPIACLGTQKYLPGEIGLTGDSLVNVHRTEDEVFSAAAMASFEGKPVTLEHPPVSVTPENSGAYTKGHAQNVRRGTGAEADLLMADLFITDADLIREIEDGLREVSCGYGCSYVPDATGRIHVNAGSEADDCAYEGGTITNHGGSLIPNTGDGMPIGMYTLMAAGSAMVLVMLLRRRKAQKRYEAESIEP